MKPTRHLYIALAVAASFGVSACWLPPAEVIREKTEMREKWRNQAKLRTTLRAEIGANPGHLTNRYKFFCGRAAALPAL